jgi:hypothetical protein
MSNTPQWSEFEKVQSEIRRVQAKNLAPTPECVAIAKCQRIRLGTTGCAAPLTPGSSASVVQLRQNEAHLPSKKGVSRSS